MIIDYDAVKNAKNIRERGLSFDRAVEFNFETAVFLIDDRCDYGETRRVAIGYLDSRLPVLCFVFISGGIRVISFRKANPREARKHGKPLTLD